MSDQTDLVLVRYDLGEVYEYAPRGRAFALAHNLDITEEPVTNPDGTARGSFRVRKASGRPDKPKTTVDESAEKKPAGHKGSDGSTEKKEN